MYKIYSRPELESRGILGVIDIIINKAYEEGNGETFDNKYHPYESPGETFVALWEGRPAGLVSCEPSVYTGDSDIAARACRLHVLKDFRAKQIGFGLLDGSDLRFKNPFGYISDKFYDRPDDFAAKGGSFQPSRYFSGETASPFFGVSHALNNKLLLSACLL